MINHAYHDFFGIIVHRLAYLKVMQVYAIIRNVLFLFLVNVVVCKKRKRSVSSAWDDNILDIRIFKEQQ